MDKLCDFPLSLCIFSCYEPKCLEPALPLNRNNITLFSRLSLQWLGNFTRLVIVWRERRFPRIAEVAVGRGANRSRTLVACTQWMGRGVEGGWEPTDDACLVLHSHARRSHHHPLARCQWLRLRVCSVR